MSPRPSHRTTLVSVFVAYLLVVTLCAPFSTQAKSLSSRKVNSPQQEQVTPHREGELLVRFRAGVSRQSKDLVIATQGAKKKNTSGNSSSTAPWKTGERFPLAWRRSRWGRGASDLSDNQ